MGNEIAQWREWNHDVSLDWHLLQWADHRGIRQLICDLNRIYKSEPSLYQVDFDSRGFEWLVLNDSDNSVLVFLRRAIDPDDCMVVACNFTPVPRQGYRVGVPHSGFYREVLNTDSHIYGGSNVGNNGGVWAQHHSWAGRPFCVDLTLPPLGVVFLKPVGEHP
jgi:1,4-alpha-glucan branching enzyme